ncbi:MAG: site-specific DNA-methyltransferase [Porticoccaceae bacterium]
MTLDPIMCVHGDSREQIGYLPWGDLGDINAIITDPPYGVDFQSGFAATEDGKKYTKKIANDNDIDSALILFRSIMASLFPHLASDAEVYVFTQWTVMEHFRQAINLIGDPFGVSVANLIIWEKGWPGLGDLAGNWPNSFEMILYAKKGRRLIPSRDCSVIAIDRLPSSKMIHPTEKPVALIRRLLEMSTNPGDLVIDPFAGSFSTADACKTLGRRCVAIEEDSDHFERGRRRVAAYDLFS